ncbi:glycosyltransferase family 2 protein [Lactobacillus acidophilus]|uniref:glycosyltransferase family 2 protein n=1 Tax=Lactobacillus acidophilus TaxID=1579 RepID=UPI0021A29F99|nr:glycosyltransferase family 2 protein [Lactobacillus acidophilus]MCT3602865.1 glycosyltransferase family 2 protein [Lactobacillus acidophilus]MCT3623325.1 glycosyltransferase family 2 protein [Lactobacillus acidophilus]
MHEDIAEVAILLATYNGERFVEEQLNSILNQTYQNFVCYIHDDGSTDETINILKKYSLKYPRKIKLLDYPGKKGAVGNFLSLIDYAVVHCKEKYYFFSDQDDIWLPEKIEFEVEKIKRIDNNVEPVLVYCDQKIVDGELNIIAESGMRYSKRNHDDDDLYHLAFENSAAGCVICINRILLELSSKYKNVNNIVMHDWWLMLIAASWGKIGYVDVPLMLYRQHGDNTLGAEQKNIKTKLKKYASNFSKAINSKNIHVKKCERQLIELNLINNEFGVNGQIKEVANVCTKSKFKKMKYFFENKYLSGNRIFTLLFL